MNLKKWLQIAFANLAIVAAIGVALRYKIAFSLPFIDQKHLLHGHSHFAFSGWVTQALMAITVAKVSAAGGKDLFKRYNWILFGNLICAYGMLFSFPVQGYGLFSIFFSTCSLFIAYLFAFYLWADINRCPAPIIAFSWFKAAAVFSAISSLGAFSLAYMMATKNMHQNWYLAAVYFFLHFQYNGWFSFVVLGLLFDKLEEIGIDRKSLRRIYLIFALACVPAYFLSALWMPIPTIIYVLVVIAAFAQVAAWGWSVNIILQNRNALKNGMHLAPYRVLLLSLTALTIKLLLQLGSTIPSLSTITFGFRPIVIGYLHLVLLGVITLFILGYAMHIGQLAETKMSKTGISVFIVAVILNELALMVQGSAAMGYIIVPFINEVLFGIAILLFAGVFMIALSKSKSR